MHFVDLNMNSIGLTCWLVVSQYVNEHLITTRNAFIVCNSTDSEIDSMEFITFATVPDILTL